MNSLKVLKFQVGNAKLIAIQDSDTGEVIVIPVHTISLPSGYSCPAADECLSKAHKVTGKITDGVDMKYRCFSASDEARSTNARNARWHNFELLRRESTATMVERIHHSLPKAAQFHRAQSRLREPSLLSSRLLFIELESCVEGPHGLFGRILVDYHANFDLRSRDHLNIHLTFMKHSKHFRGHA